MSDHGLIIETSPRLSSIHPSHWVVTAPWYGKRVIVFESEPEHDDLVQLEDCMSYVQDFEKGTL